MPSLGNTLLIAFLFVTVGFIGGVLVCLFWMERQKTAGEAEGERPSAQRRDLLEVAHLWREAQNGQLQVEVEGEIVARTEALDEARRSRLQQAAREWLAWLEAGAPSLPAEEKTSPPVAPAAGRPPLPPTQPAKEAGRGAQKSAASIVAQIDEIVQDLVKRAPQPVPAVRLVEDARHGVIVWVGNEAYNGVEAVNDPQIKALLRAAVAEWERRMEQKKTGG